MCKKLIAKNAVLILLITSFFLHFWGLEHPDEVVFDEVHFGKFASSYLNGSYHFDIHPPLGKMFLAAGGALTGFKPDFGFSNIGDKYPDSTYYGLRFFPALAGSLIPLVVYLILRVLGLSKRISLLGMAIMVFENSLLIQSKFVLIDAFLILFGLASILFYLLARKQKTFYMKIFSLLISGLLAGASFSIKWTGLVFYFVVFALGFSSLLKHLIQKNTQKIKPIMIFTLAFLVVPIAFYASVFALHFSMLPYSGGGDAFMSQQFQSTLKNNPNYNPEAKMGFSEKFLELNKVMLSANSGITASHPYAIKWYYMPVMYRSLYYWTEAGGNTTSRIYLIGNPFIWWAVLISVIFLSGNILWSLARKNWKFFRENKILIIFLVAYFLNLATYAFVSRVIFLYHYFPSLVLGIFIFCLTAKKLFEKRSKLFIGFLILIIGSFIFLSPLTYGLPLDKFSYDMRNWLPTWI